MGALCRTCLPPGALESDAVRTDVLAVPGVAKVYGDCPDLLTYAMRVATN